MRRPDRNVALNIATGTILALLLAVTLTPSSSTTIDFRSLCLICGERGLADTILNIALFMPLGFALGTRIQSGLRAYVIAVAISTGIEFAQVFIPGRDSSLADIVFNGLGAALGVGLARSWRLWLLPSPRAARSLGALAALGALAVLATTDLLMRPDFPSMQYDAAWTPRSRNMVHYEGSVLQASVGETATPNGLLADSETVREQLLAGEPLHGSIVAGAVPDGTAIVLSINGFQLEVASLRLHRFDLVFRYRMRSNALRLDRPQLRIPGALLEVSPGEIIPIGAERRGRDYCMWVGDFRRCDLGFTLGDGWSLLLWTPNLPVALASLLGLIWLAGLTVPVGYWTPGIRSAAVGAAAIGLALALIPGFGYLLTTPWPQFAAAVAGVALGRTLQGLVRRGAG